MRRLCPIDVRLFQEVEVFGFTIVQDSSDSARQSKRPNSNRKQKKTEQKPDIVEHKPKENSDRCKLPKGHKCNHGEE
jgi:hypothetical protein